jgi:fructose-1,6-bisphosphatase-3
MIGDKEYPMLDTYFPTVDPSYPLKLTAEEEELLHTLVLSFRHSDLLQKHIRFLYSNGALYKCCNGNLMYHGCIPMREDGSFESMIFDGQEMSGRELMDYIGEQIRRAYFLKDDALDKQNAVDFMWYLWCGAKSPVFGKDRMTTFENYFVEDKSTHKEKFNPYYKLSQDEAVCNRILEEFGLPTEGSHIINGHVPVKIKDGETPVKANGKLYVIDGGLSKAYQKQTGIAGYTLIYNSHHLALAEHMPFHPDKENTPRVSITEKMPVRVLVGNTDKGEELKIRIADLCELVSAYRSGLLKEHD